ncbi:MAG: response regulator [Synergistaceae bacterium]|nr:response regulator [Synergistaceae bacterium]
MGFNNYIFETEFAVVFLNIVLCVYLHMIYSGTSTMRASFVHYCYVAAAGSVIEMIYSVVLGNSAPHLIEIKCLFAVLNQIALNCVYFMFMRYIGSFVPESANFSSLKILQAYTSKRFYKNMRYAQNVIMGTFFYFQLVSVFLKSNYFVENNQIMTGSMNGFLNYGYMLIWTVWTWIEIFLCRKSFTKGQWLGLIANLLISWLLLFLQYKYLQNINISVVIISVNLYVYFFLLETPAYKELEKTLDRLKKVKALADEANEIAVKADAAKSEFLANMSHEIRTPLTTIMGMDEMILRKYDEGPIYEYASDIRSAGNTLLHIINDILDFSKIESGQLELAPKNYDLGRVLKDVENMIRIRANQKGLEFITQIDEHLPNDLFGDRVRVHQIMINILNNGVKYTRHGSVKFTITGERGDDPSLIVFHINVTDTGIGIHAEDIPKLFQSFSRIDLKETHNIEGTGLGLAITGRLIEMMGGTVDVNSTYGMGSTFHVVLPQRIVGHKTLKNYEEEHAHSKKQVRKSFTAPEAKILVVDDNDMNRIVLRALMKETKVQIEDVESGADCLRKAAEVKYDVILMDYMMPRMDGKETLARLRADENAASRDTKVIVCTANAIVGVKAEMMQAGFDDFLSKPVNGIELEELLMKYIPADKQQERLITTGGTK